MTAMNISTYLKENAARHPFRRAVVYPAARDTQGRVAYSHLTFEQLEQASDQFAHGLVKAGIEKGTRTVLMVTPGIDFFVLTFALFKVGAVPVVVDPGMGIGRMLSCFRETSPEAFVGIPKAHVLRLFSPKTFSAVKTWVTVGRRWAWRGATTKSFYKLPAEPFEPAATRKEDVAAILFTTGSTGPAKGVVYTHGTFDAQVRQIRDYFNLGQEEIDLPTFPLFALFDPALGMTAVIPDMDPTKPAKVNAAKIIEAITNQGVTNMFASPALLNRVGRFGAKHNVKLPSLKRVVSAGAPVTPANIKQFSTLLADSAAIHTPYGATEAVPVMAIDSREILSETAKRSEQGFGMCVGRPLTGIDVRIIQITDNAIETWTDDLVLGEGDIGEIVVRGDLVSTRYFENNKANALAKIADNGTIWHRMGDLGWQDKHGRIWFCGRKSHRVETKYGPLFTIPCEAIFNNHPLVFRSALVGVGKKPNQVPVMCIETVKKSLLIPKKKLKEELAEMARENVLTKNIYAILFHPDFPVDIRHNSKIFREKLAIWAQGKLTKTKSLKKKRTS